MKYPVTPHLQALTEGPDIPLEKPIVLIGRHQECDIQIPSRKISRRHCCLAQVGDHLVVRDLGSTNGVRINGIKVIEGNLQPNDELMIGNVRYQVKWDDELPAASSDSMMAGSMKNGIMAVKASPHRNGSPADSGERPIALPDVSQMQAIPLAKPIAPGPHHAGDALPPQMFPDNIELMPLDPS